MWIAKLWHNQSLMSHILDIRLNYWLPAYHNKKLFHVLFKWKLDGTTNFLQLSYLLSANFTRAFCVRMFLLKNMEERRRIHQPSVYSVAFSVAFSVACSVFFGISEERELLVDIYLKTVSYCIPGVQW